MTDIEFDAATKERLETFKKKLDADFKLYVEKYKDVKCTFHGCELWSQCSNYCNGLYHDHAGDCKSFSYGWRSAIDTVNNTHAPW